jgi:elongation factor Ts
MTISSEQIKELRDRTGISMMSCKKALEEAGGDIEKAILGLREEGAKVADKKSSRELKAGIIVSYVHATKKVGVMLEARSETDFVAKNEGFQEMAYNVAMHIAGMNTENIEELMTQPYIKNPEITVSDYVKESIQKFGENIEISRFVRYNV